MTRPRVLACQLGDTNKKATIEGPKRKTAPAANRGLTPLTVVTGREAPVSIPSQPQPTPQRTDICLCGHRRYEHDFVGCWGHIFDPDMWCGCTRFAGAEAR